MGEASTEGGKIISLSLVSLSVMRRELGYDVLWSDLEMKI